MGTVDVSTASARRVSHLSADLPFAIAVNSAMVQQTQCFLITTNDNAVITEPFTADDVEVAVNELSPRSTQSAERANMSPMINALTNATCTVASIIAMVKGDTEVPVPRRTTRSQSTTRLNLAATFEGFVPANNPNAWRDRDLY